MLIALAGAGRMGSVLAGRLGQAGHQVRVFDVSESATDAMRERGFEVCGSLAAAASGAEVVFLCLPDARAVEAAVEGAGGLLAARPAPALCVDLTSSLPRVTRRLGGVLARSGIGFLDAPLSGGVAGAGSGRLTAMVGGDAALLARAAPILACFAARVLAAGDLGAGHCVKAVNNALSATSLAATCEMLLVATAFGHPAERAVAEFNAGIGRSQNSEVKLPRDILPGTFASGFTVALMRKDVAAACDVAAEHGLDVPVVSAVLDLWSLALARLGGEADYTRVIEVIEGMRLEGAPELGSEGPRLDVLDMALAASCRLAAVEMMAVVEAEGIERSRALEIVNASTGRSEATRREESWPLSVEEALHALGDAGAAGRRAGLELPVTAAAAARLEAAGWG